MKRIWILFIVLLLDVQVLSGCSSAPGTDILTHNRSYKVLIYDFSDLATGTSLSFEYSFWHDDIPDSKKIIQHATIEVNGKILQGEFSDYVNIAPDNYTQYQYRCDDGTRFATDANGNLVTYSRVTSKSDTSQNFAQSECLKIAKDFLRDFVDPDLYQVTAEYDKFLGAYTFHFTKNIRGYKTADSAYVTVSSSGEITDFYSFMLGRIPIDTHIGFDQDEAIASVQSKLAKIYPDHSVKYDKVEFEIEPQMVTLLDNGETAMLVEANVAQITFSDDGSYYTISERLSFVVSLND